MELRSRFVRSRVSRALVADQGEEVMLSNGIVRPTLALETLSPLDYLLLSVEIGTLSASQELERQKSQGPDVGN
jgi:hypothetical protein